MMAFVCRALPAYRLSVYTVIRYKVTYVGLFGLFNLPQRSQTISVCLRMNYVRNWEHCSEIGLCTTLIASRQTAVRPSKADRGWHWVRPMSSVLVWMFSTWTHCDLIKTRTHAELSMSVFDRHIAYVPLESLQASDLYRCLYPFESKKISNAYLWS